MPSDQFVVVPSEMHVITADQRDLAEDIATIENFLRQEAAATRLNSADPNFSVAVFTANLNAVSADLRFLTTDAVATADEIDDARSDAETADSNGIAWGRNLADFLLGDALSFWDTAGSDATSVGSAIAGAVRISRTRTFLATASKTKELPPLPVFNNGRVGLTLARGLQRVPVSSAAAAGQWLETGASTTFKWLGIGGAIYGTATGLYGLYQQGNPLDAYEREGAGYIADVANTAFNASSAAFLIAPSPITGALVIGTGAVWLGAEVVDNWDTISETASTAWDAGTGWLNNAADIVNPPILDYLDPSPLSLERLLPAWP